MYSTMQEQDIPTSNWGIENLHSKICLKCIIYTLLSEAKTLNEGVWNLAQLSFYGGGLRRQKEKEIKMVFDQ